MIRFKQTGIGLIPENEKPRSMKQEKYTTIYIKDLESQIRNELFPAAFGICNKIEKEGERDLAQRIKQTVSKCPLGECVILNNNPTEISKCPEPMCWIAEGPTWQEFLLPEISNIYFMLMDTYLEALNIPDDPDEKVTFIDGPLNVMKRKLKSRGTQDFILKSFKDSRIFGHRSSIIKDILWIHNKGRYLLSVPLLIIQIEGILHDLAYYFKWRFEKNEMYYEESAKIWAIIKKLKDRYFEKAMMNFYKRQKGSKECPRNLILHGRSLDYGKTHKLSTVLFLVLIYLIAFSQMINRRITIE